MDFDFGMERIHTETTFVKDEKLSQHHERFEESVVKRAVLNGKNPLEDEYSIYRLHIERDRLPSGSNTFQSVLGEFVKGKTVDFAVREAKSSCNGKNLQCISHRGSKHSQMNDENKR